MKFPTCPLRVFTGRSLECSLERSIINKVFYNSHLTLVTFFSFLMMAILRRQQQLKATY